MEIRDTITALFESLRPRQWIKNTFVFAPIVFSHNLIYAEKLLAVAGSFMVFCLLSSSIYIFNDIIDLEYDRLHPTKSKRPIASGRLSIRPAVGALAFLVPVAIAAAFLLGLPMLIVALVYLSIQALYCLKLKQVIIIDVLIIAFGFLLRIVAGAYVIDVSISSWLFICTFLLALFLALNKRRAEIVSLKAASRSYREVLGQYSPYLIDQMITIVTAATLVAYSLYTVSEETVNRFGTKDLIFTVPFVLYGLFRYLYLVQKKKMGQDPEGIVMSDRPLIVTIAAWMAISCLIIYL
jgi:4-hydroxybenzoate polyprenyltransferase